MSTPVKVACAIALFVLVVATTAAQPSLASGMWYVATSGSDGNDCATPTTPCASINGALNKPGFVAGDTIRVAVGTYSGTGDEVVLLNKSVNLSGGWISAFNAQAGTSTVDGQRARNGVTINLGVTAIVDRFTIRNGFAEYGGGGISNSGGTLTLINSTVTANSSKFGGGGITSSNGALTVINSTISGNTTGEVNYYSGGGAGGISVVDSTVWLKSTTVANNSELGAWSPSAIKVGGPTGVVYLQNTIIADNPPDPVTGAVCVGNINSIG